MDVLVLIDKLDDLVHDAKAVPLTDQVRIDREEIYDILDQMRATIPEEIKQARWIVKERQEMLAEAKREAERIIKEARDEQGRLIGEEEVVLAARVMGGHAVDDVGLDAEVGHREERDERRDACPLAVPNGPPGVHADRDDEELADIGDDRDSAHRGDALEHALGHAARSEPSGVPFCRAQDGPRWASGGRKVASKSDSNRRAP